MTCIPEVQVRTSARTPGIHMELSIDIKGNVEYSNVKSLPLSYTSIIIQST